MTKEMIMTQLFEFSAPTYYKWKKQDKRKIISLIEYAFSDEDLVEFLNSGKISKIEEIGSQDYLIDLSLITPFEKSHWSLADGMNRIANLDLLYSFV